MNDSEISLPMYFLTLLSMFFLCVGLILSYNPAFLAIFQGQIIATVWADMGSPCWDWWGSNCSPERWARRSLLHWLYLDMCILLTNRHHLTIHSEITEQRHLLNIIKRFCSSWNLSWVPVTWEITAPVQPVWRVNAEVGTCSTSEVPYL